MRKRSAQVILGVVLASVLSACGSTESDYTEVCVDNRTGERIPEDECDDDDGHGGHRGGWVYFPHGSHVPAVGSKVTGGSRTFPASGTIGRAPSSGGFGSHGTFGGSGT